MNRKIEIEDTLHLYCEDAVIYLKECINWHLRDDIDIKHFDLRESGLLENTCETKMPIATYDIESIWFFNRDKLIPLIEDYDFDGSTYTGMQVFAIYKYLYKYCSDWYWSIEDELNECLERYKCGEDTRNDFIDNIKVLRTK